TNTLRRQPQMLLRMTLIYLTALYDGFVSDLLLAVWRERPETLKSRRHLTHEEALSASSIEELHALIAHQEAVAFGNDPLRKQMSYLQERLGIATPDDDALAALARVRLMRNLFVHHNGRITPDYKALSGQANLIEGEPLEISEADVENASEVLKNTAV